MNKDIFYHLKIKYVCILKFLNQGNLWFNNCHIKKLNTSDVLQMFYADIKLPYLLLKLSSNKKKKHCAMCWHQEYSHPSIELSTFQISSYRTWDTSLLLLNSLGFIYIPADFNLFDVLHEIYILTILHTNCHYNFANGCGVVLRYLTVCVEYLCLRLNKAFGSSQLCGVDFWSCS